MTDFIFFFIFILFFPSSFVLFCSVLFCHIIPWFTISYIKPDIFITFSILYYSSKTPTAIPSSIPILESNSENKSVNIENEKSEVYPPGSYVVSSRKNEFISLSPKDMKLISAYGANVQLLLKDCDNVVISRCELFDIVYISSYSS